MFEASPLCRRLNIKYPLILGGMSWIGKAKLAAAVSAAGGLGTLGAGAMSVSELSEEIRKYRSLSSAPFAVNLVMIDPSVEEKIEVIISERVPVAIFGAGNPGKSIRLLNKNGTITMGVVSSENLALLLERAGIDYIIGEGCESGGHIGNVGTMVLIPKLVDVLKVPVIAAGGIADGRGVAAAFMLGAAGVQVGTRFIASLESDAHPKYKDMVIKSGIRDTLVTGEELGHPVRVIKTVFTKKVRKMEIITKEETEKLLLGSFPKAYKEGNLEEGSFLAGQCVGLIHDIEPCEVIIRRMFDQASHLLEQSNNNH
jgi:enoyl-[acyl-carrier protein] reductase II